MAVVAKCLNLNQFLNILKLPYNRVTRQLST